MAVNPLQRGRVIEATYLLVPPHHQIDSADGGVFLTSVHHLRSSADDNAISIVRQYVAVVAEARQTHRWHFAHRPNSRAQLNKHG